MEFRAYEEVEIPSGKVTLKGDLVIPETARAIVVFSHGSGSSRFSTRNQAVARYLIQKNFGTLLFDLLTPEEDVQYQNRFDIDLLTTRLADATRWLAKLPAAKDCAIGYFGASTGAASALKAAALIPSVCAVVSRGGRPDLAADSLPKVKAPVLLIVGSLDEEVIVLNRMAYEELGGEKKLEIVAGATHLFEEPGKLDIVAALAAKWFEKYTQPEYVPG
ncbi:dienelactone hydrolase family protein [Flavihumibacter fluvii]|uniref:dienelactone hydrolase family protein n=1 Tax=Flavihumibacter fluvii TaxID=2838157 RepID=UPI001BDDE8EF|nr:dienelactone hydrolase family protein [Flavihumibacter fluvii]ULQ53319.1 dienelactone hydrolase family protein [Flavihumibacter fluvii]